MRQIVLFFVAILAFSSAGAQETAVQRSTDRVKIDGKTYFIHIVKSGETLYAISKAYDISQSAIATSNPDIYGGLKVGQALKIPQKPDEPQSDENYFYHIVKRQETLFGISRQYNVSVDDIVKLNPGAKDGLQKSQTLRIPKFRMEEQSEKTEKPEKPEKPTADTLTFILHEVQPREGLFAVSRRYGVDVKEIEAYNQEVLANGPKLGTSLRIPIRHKANTAALAAEASPAGGSPVVGRPCQSSYVYGGEPFSIALFMPFTQAEAGTYDGAIEEAVEQQLDAKPKSPERTGKGFSALTNASLEFYEGFLLAVDTMKKAGVSVNLSVFDTKRKPAEVANLLQKSSAEKTDLIVGSFIYDDLKPLALFAAERGINMVSPLYNGAGVLTQSPGIISINQPFRRQLEIFINSFKFEDTCRYVVIHDKESLYSTTIKQFDSLLNLRTGGDSGRVQKFYHQTASRNSAEVQEQLVKVLAPDRQNVIIIPSEDEPFVSEFLGHLYGVKSFYNLRTAVYGPARWQKMRNIPSDYFYRLNLNVFTTFFVDYSRPEVKRFIAEYRSLYRAEPSQHSYLGYDIGVYFISAMRRYGANFNECLHTYRPSLLQSEFWFPQSTGKSALQNERQFIINYTDGFELKRVK